MKNEIIENEENKKSTKYLFFKIGLVLAVLLLVTLLWARYISTSGLIVKEYAINNTKLNDDYDGFKIVHFTDLHYGSTVFESELKKVVNEINKQKPDIVVFTGDLVESGVSLTDDDIKVLIKELKKINPRIETLAVDGNHDYNNHDYFEKVMAELDWHVLNNTYEFVYGNSKKPIVFVGLKDLMYGKQDYENAFSFINETDEELYTIVLAHEPDQILEFSSYNFDLVLSGHSHLGQVRIPFIGAIYTPVGSKKYYDEYYKVNNADLYISGGIGTSTIKFRFFNKPSINLYRFYTK
ncbi:MAG: metallophosphoesterase [Bacilli bacterium]|nr:metallophosphoesterase [Bacilli bacterium]